ncbi:GntR family transcriptional regulator [Cellulomonas humilata]|uniref:GntR family transcriptional regulator n=1 Tax=Cellulomonas humilata TaxID=144055 RepID=A0A7Y6A334_9CELL|nr:GntR family transcriptional regulator [Cellulomonas humilata]NUU17584.1 GntR family transcriptional regulator [Cellulomonas humilata]
MPSTPHPKGTGGRGLRAEVAADAISQLARQSGPGARLGSRAELREECGVSIGTLHEALRLLQSTGEIVVRTGPGGGVFAGDRSALSDLLRRTRGQTSFASDLPQVVRLLRALSPLILEDAIGSLTTEGADLLRQRLDDLISARDGGLRDVVRASLDLFATLVSIPDFGLLRVVAGALLGAQIGVLPTITSAIDPDWSEVVDRHIDAASDLTSAILGEDLTAAVAARDRPEFMGLFAALAEREHT